MTFPKATASIRRLRSGNVPAEEIEGLSVGYEHLRDIVLERIIQLGERQRVGPLLARGEWDSGKSHFTSYVRTLCGDLGVASSLVSLNARGHALNHPQRSYPLLAENVELGDLPRGLQSVLTAKLADEDGRQRLEQFARSSNGELQQAVWSLCRSREAGSQHFAEHRAWNTILGGDVAWANYAYKRKKAIARISEMGKLFKALGGDGLVLLFDETETIDQLWNIRSRKGAYSVLGALSQIEHVWCIFAVTARFDRVIDRDLLSVFEDSRLAEDARWFLRKWEKDDLDVLDLPGIDKPKAKVLCQNVAELYERAHSFHLENTFVIDELVEDWAEDPNRNPRMLIRTVIDQLDRDRSLTT